jgi:hemerythrin superfamily protein
MNPVAARLSRDHQELDSLLRRLVDDARAPEPGALQKTWSALEAQLTRHMEAEERFLLPLLEATDPAEVKRIREDHERIRYTLSEVGISVELHTVRAGRVTELAEMLRAHAQREDGALYRLAGEKASSAVEQGIARLLRHGVAVAASVLASHGSAGERSEASAPRRT